MQRQQESNLLQGINQSFTRLKSLIFSSETNSSNQRVRERNSVPYVDQFDKLSFEQIAADCNKQLASLEINIRTIEVNLYVLFYLIF